MTVHGLLDRVNAELEELRARVAKVEAEVAALLSERLARAARVKRRK